MSTELITTVQEMLKEETWTRATISNYTKNNLTELTTLIEKNKPASRRRPKKLQCVRPPHRAKAKRRHRPSSLSVRMNPRAKVNPQVLSFTDKYIYYDRTTGRSHP